MASHFKVSSVIGQVEHHLLNNSKFDIITMIWMADKYRMQRLLDKSISLVDSKKKAEDVKSSPEFPKLSSDTKGRLFERLVLLL
ncbi:hypothetical protein GCK72_000471 [Caenorhabditis remanei]|uniref:Uncharacterized protein n=1 Tax=Caenorhabditis remanei TaxID=31234 RepID=A0A6A5HL86_CAERE|nr:hypothetical protein GCK72_000471 [Caenorhabditis remanei]KAF1768658.1 hypothetical protein GCK72_000471 [Caenorhabditis remanei]